MEVWILGFEIQLLGKVRFEIRLNQQEMPSEFDLLTLCAVKRYVKQGQVHFPLDAFTLEYLEVALSHSLNCSQVMYL
jgi:hypothetical protein